MLLTKSRIGGAVLRVALGSLLAASLARDLPAAGPLGTPPPRWRPLGPEGGYPYVVAFAPRDPLLVYAGLGGGGVFTSTDGGLTWHAPHGPLAGHNVLSLAVDPDTPGTAFAGADGVVWKTTTGGSDWHAGADHLAGDFILALALDPVQRQTVYAATPSGVFRSSDAGETWTAVSKGLLPNSGRVAGFALTGPGRLFVAWDTDEQLNELFTSSDGGTSWTLLSGSGVPQFDQPSGLLWDGASHTLFLTAVPPHFQQGLRTLWRTSDGGATWVQTALPARLGINSVTLAVDPAGDLYAGGDGVFASSDQGRSWNEIGPVAGGGGNPRPFDLVTALAADPSRPGRLLAGSVFGGGLFENTGGDWHTVNHGLTATGAAGLVVASGPQRHGLFAAVVFGGVFASGDFGAHWTPRNDGLVRSDSLIYEISLESDPRRQTLYTGVLGGVARSRDGGAHWQVQPVNDCTVPTVFGVDPETATVYAGGETTSAKCSLPCFAYVSRDAGTTWGCLPGIYEAGVGLVDPLVPSVVYVAKNYGGLLKSSDRGHHFVHVDNGLGANDFFSLAISPAAHRVVYAGTENRVWKSFDGGGHWMQVGTGLPPGGLVIDLVADPHDPAIVYAGVLGQGVFQSTDGSATWTPINLGLPVAAYGGPLRLDPGPPRTLYAGTGGSGFWALTLP
jgi:photosystem II stability/assembly factor-like uncharacterized protein